MAISDPTPASRTIHQPLHPSVRPHLDPEYIAFHEKYMQYIVPDDAKIWDGSARTDESLPPGGSPLTNVGRTEDFQLPGFKLRAYSPQGEHDGKGWPVFLWFHGGGWAIGGLGSGADFLTLVCEKAKCVVLTVDYRLAPEHPYPAAVDDAITAYQWLLTKGKALLDLDTTRISIGGTSAGSNLSIVLALKTAQLNLQPPTFQLLIVPVIDNTATVDGVWAQNQHAPWLTPKRMLWYRRMYLPNERDWSDWAASPNLAPAELLRKMPSTWMARAETDLLEPEGARFAEQLRALGVHVDEVVVEGATHSILALNGYA